MTGVVALWSSLAALPGAEALPTVTPEYRQSSFPEIKLEEMKTFTEKGKGPVLDARDEKAYAEGHIPGALSLPADPPVVFDRVYGLKKYQLADKSVPIVVYCTNQWCPLSETLYKRLAVLGYRNVLVFRAGFDGWRQKGLPVKR